MRGYIVDTLWTVQLNVNQERISILPLRLYSDSIHLYKLYNNTWLYVGYIVMVRKSSYTMAALKVRAGRTRATDQQGGARNDPQDTYSER